MGGLSPSSGASWGRTGAGSGGALVIAVCITLALEKSVGRARTWFLLWRKDPFAGGTALLHPRPTPPCMQHNSTRCNGTDSVLSVHSPRKNRKRVYAVMQSLRVCQSIAFVRVHPCPVGWRCLSSAGLCPLPFVQAQPKSQETTVTQGHRTETGSCMRMDMKGVHVGYSSTSHGSQSHRNPSKWPALYSTTLWWKQLSDACPSPSFLASRQTMGSHSGDLNMLHHKKKWGHNKQRQHRVVALR